MFIRIQTSFKDFSLQFEDDDKFKKFQLQIAEALLDQTNSKGAIYEDGDTHQIFPSILLKSSVIRVEKGEGQNTYFFF